MIGIGFAERIIDWDRTMSDSRRTTVTLPTGPAEGVTVFVAESTERWSEFRLDDGTVVRGKLTVASAVRVDGQFDQQGNPLYTFNLAPVLAFVSVPDELRRKEH